MVFRSSTSSPPAASRRRRAFTLIEVLVASGVTVLLVGFIVVIVSNVSNFWTRSSGSLTAGSQARYALDQLTLDLQSALYRDDGGTWLAATISANTSTSGFWDTRNALVVKPTNMNADGSLRAVPAIDPDTRIPNPVGANSAISPRFGQAGMWLRFFTTKRGANSAADLATISAPVAVGWQIVRRPASVRVGNLDIRYFLHRAEVRATTISTSPGTLQSGYSIVAPAYTTGVGTSNNSGVTSGDPRGVQVPGGVASDYAIIGENVIDFGVRLFIRDPSGPELVAIFPLTNAAESHFAANPPRVGAISTQFPEVADVMIRVLTDEGARLIATFEAGRLTAPTGRSNAQYWWDLALANSKVYSRRIVLRAEPL